MGKASRRRSPVGTPAIAATDAAEVPVVPGRQACPCGSGRRYKACHGRERRAADLALVTRPFESLPGECDWVAMREIVPAATASVRTTPEFGGHDVTVATVLPMAWPALRRADGAILVGLQTTGGSGDASRDVAAALLAAIDAEPGTPVAIGGLPGPGPRLQDILDTQAGFTIDVHEGFDFWLDGVQDTTADVRESMERANSAVVPTAKVDGVEAAYWCRIAERRHLRWILPHPEDLLLDAIARLHAAGHTVLTPGSRYVGAFRADGLLVPVWDLAEDTEAGELVEPCALFAERLAQALARTAPLSADERRARAGVVSRQVTLR